MLARCMRLQQVVDRAWLLVAEFLVVLELEWLLLVSEEPNLAVRHFHFWEVLTVEQLVMVRSLRVEFDGFSVLNNLVRCMISS